MDVLQSKNTNATMKKINHKHLNSTELAEETRRMEMQLAKIKAEKDKLTKMIPSALPGTLHWSSAAIENSNRRSQSNHNEKYKSNNNTVSSNAGGKKSLSDNGTNSCNASPVSYANTFRNMNGSPSSNQPGILASTSNVSAVAGSGLRAVAAMRNLPSTTTNDATSTVTAPNNNNASSAASSSSKLQPSQAMHWTLDQVQQWLTVLGLEQHIPIFIQNDIIGQVLLDLTPGDLDYMNITTLGHRKLILKGIDQLKTAINGGNNSKGSSGNTTATTSIATDVKVSSNNSSASPPKIHWSQTLPSTTAQTSGTVAMTNSSHTNTLLDGQYDEDAERRAFQDAVMAWRKANGKSVSIIKSNEDDNGMWTNPFGSNDDDNNNSSSTENTVGNQGGSLLDGQYDEEAERRAFQEAVMAWRNGTGSVPTDNSTGKSKTVTNINHTSSSSESGVASSSTNSRSSCYNCLRIFYGHLGYHPSVQHESDEEENPSQSKTSSSTLVRSLVSKPFCSSACYDAAAMGVLRLEAAKNAARADAENLHQKTDNVPLPSDENSNNDTNDDNGSVDYEYPNDSPSENNHRRNGILNAADYGISALPPSPVVADSGHSISGSQITEPTILSSSSSSSVQTKSRSTAESFGFIDNLAAEAEAAGLSLVREYEQQVNARKHALMQASMRSSRIEKENESKYNDDKEQESKEEILVTIDIATVDMSDYI